MIREAHGQHTLWAALAHPRVLMLSLVYFGTAAASYALGIWLPTIVKDFGFSNLQTGVITAIPYLVGAVAVFIWPFLSDRMHERKVEYRAGFSGRRWRLGPVDLFPGPGAQDGRALYLRTSIA